ncbi:archaetidylserine decarboxylase [Haliangium sp.]|uniref:archaetidylserine decarboxylase n=1 Tax=Haliangium sp. TaxID=2663208 RepID=UPI003D12DEDD
MGASLDEVERPLDEYRSVGEFFARRLRPGVRPQATATDALVAPCDGRVAAIGETARGRMIQAKGKDYTLANLLADDEFAATLEGGPYLTIYLSPADYHRVHTPVAGSLLGYTHLPGTLFPVNPLFSRSIDGLMAINERVVFYLDTELGPAALVMVAAVGVSDIELSHQAQQTRHLRGRAEANGHGARHRIDLTPAAQLERGDELGAFHLGSTTILVFSPGSVDLAPLRPGDPVRFGQEIGRPRDPQQRS